MVLIRQRIRYKYYNWRDRRAVKVGQIYEDCNYRLMYCLKNHDGDLTGVDILTGRVGCCAVSGCGAYVVEPGVVQEYISKQR